MASGSTERRTPPAGDYPPLPRALRVRAEAGSLGAHIGASRPLGRSLALARAGSWGVPSFEGVEAGGAVHGEPVRPPWLAWLAGRRWGRTASLMRAAGPAGREAGAGAQAVAPPGLAVRSGLPGPAIAGPRLSPARSSAAPVSRARSAAAAHDAIARDVGASGGEAASVSESAPARHTLARPDPEIVIQRSATAASRAPGTPNASSPAPPSRFPA